MFTFFTSLTSKLPALALTPLIFGSFTTSSTFEFLDNNAPLQRLGLNAHIEVSESNSEFKGKIGP